MPSIPGRQLELEKHQSSSSAPNQRPSLLALTASSISPPNSISSIHVERSRDRTTGGELGNMTGEDRKEGSSRSLGRNSGKSQALRAKKGGGGFLLGMGSGYGVDVRDPHKPLRKNRLKVVANTTMP